jgi:hypothetical protein
VFTTTAFDGILPGVSFSQVNLISPLEYYWTDIASQNVRNRHWTGVDLVRRRVYIPIHLPGMQDVSVLMSKHSESTGA